MPRVTFVGKRALVRVHPNATTPAHALLKFGSIFEVDRFGRKVGVHSVPSLAALTPTMTYGSRTAGSASYTWVKLRYGTSQLGLNLTAYSCALAAQQSIAQEQAARASFALAAQRAQLEAMQAGGGVGGAVPPGAALGGMPASSLPPGYAALQGGGAGVGAGYLPGAMPPAMGPAAGAAFNPFAALPRSPVYSVAPTNVYGKKRRMLQQYAYAPQKARPTFANWGPAPATQTGYLAPPAYGAGAGAGAVAGSAAGGGATFDPTSEGYLTLTFYTGFANATTFPYGKGNSVTAPGNGLKWSLEIVNWPFCSFDHTLAMEVFASTSKGGSAMGQWTAGSEDAAPADRAHAAQAAGRGPASTMVNEAFAPPVTRRRALKQAGLGAYLSYMDADEEAALAAKSGGRGAKPKGGPAYGTTRVAKLLLNDTAAVELGFPTYAFESPIGARAVNVSILLDSVLTPSPPGQPSPPAQFTLGFPYFQSIYYDPTLAFGDSMGMPISDLAQLPAGCTDVSCSGAQAAGVKVKRGAAGEKGAKNGAESVGKRSGVAAVVVGLLAVVVAAL
jgi:hypothetical protein